MFTMKGMLVFISFTGIILQGKKIVSWGKKKLVLFRNTNISWILWRQFPPSGMFLFLMEEWKKAMKKKIPTYVYIIIFIPNICSTQAQVR